ncbi:MAG: hypothetical protein ACRBG0_21130 [Lewinella sp.]|uniref:hypothetical protein n=1 Tax=Lewinella sp. TaxID=2004506 RepID=UPI003D6B7234
MRIFSFLLILFCVTSTNAQSEGTATQIPGTNFYLEIPEAYTLLAESNGITDGNVTVGMLEMADVNYENEKSDFDNIQSDYAAKGIELKEKRAFKFGKYDALFFDLATTPKIYQVFFGAENFCGFFNIIVNNEQDFELAPLLKMLSSVSYRPSTLDPMEEHALFTIGTEEQGWSFANFSMNSFGFEHEGSEDMLLIMQLPGQVLLQARPQDLLIEMRNKFRLNEEMTIKTMDEGTITVAGEEGYFMELEVTTKSDGDTGLLYLCCFGNKNAVLLFQGMGDAIDKSSLERYKKLLPTITIKGLSD